MKLTIREIASLAGVSTTTVSHILNDKGQRFSEETREKVLKIVEEHNYSPNYFASNIIKNKSRLIGVIVPDITEVFASTLINLIRKPLNEEGYNLMTCESSSSIEEELALLERYRQLSAEAILMFTSSKLSEKITNNRYHGIPVIFIDAGINDNYYGKIFFNEYDTAVRAINWLIKKGHRHIGLITANDKQHAFPERADAYYDALAANGLSLNKQYVVKTEFTIEKGYEGTQKLLQQEKLTAIFCCDDNLALGCYQAIYDAGKVVNQDIDIIGFDGVEILKHIRPKVKTLHLPFGDFGDLIATKIITAIAEPLKKQPDTYFNMIFNEGEE